MLLRRNREAVQVRRIPALALLACASSLVLVGCGAHPSPQASHKLAPLTVHSAPTTTNSGPAASAFDPEGASTPSAAAVGFENAIKDRDGAGVCDFISPAYLAAAAEEQKDSPSEPCVKIWTGAFQSEGPSPTPLQDEHPSVVSVQQTGDSAQVVIDYNIPANEGFTLANDTDALVLQNGRWLVSPPDN